MLDDPDAVLAAIPALAAAGPALAWLVGAVEPVAGVAWRGDPLTLALLGPVAALAVTGMTVVDPPFETEE